MLLKLMDIQVFMMMMTQTMLAQDGSVAKTADYMVILGAKMEVDAQTMGDKE